MPAEIAVSEENFLREDVKRRLRRACDALLERKLTPRDFDKALATAYRLYRAPELTEQQVKRIDEKVR